VTGALTADTERSIRRSSRGHHRCTITTQLGGHYARASYASGGGGASRVPRIAGDVTAGSALASCVPVGDALCAGKAPLFDLLWHG
jgi:hypothetical protein